LPNAYRHGVLDVRARAEGRFSPTHRHAEDVYAKTAESGAKRAQALCPECGTRIYAGAAVDPQVFNVRVGTLHQRAALPPKAQYWCRSALAWVMDLRGVKTAEKQ
jgi:hypothetical protein